MIELCLFIRPPARSPKPISRRGTFIRVALLYLVYIFLLGPAEIFAHDAEAESEQSFGEYSIKAAFIYNFIKLAELPTQNQSVLFLCILGGEQIQNSMKDLNGKTNNGYRIKVVPIVNVSQAKQCQVAFFGGAMTNEQKSSLDFVSNSGVLTVGEDDGFLTGGGMIRFYMEDDKVRFEVNPYRTESSGIRLSSKLLSLARIVSVSQ